MANVLIDENTMKSIGNAIRAKTGNSDLILPSNMPSAIEGIETGGSGGVGIGDISDCGYHSVIFIPLNNITVPANSVNDLLREEVDWIDSSYLYNSAVHNEVGYIYGHPEIIVYIDYTAKYWKYINKIINLSLTDFYFSNDTEYTLVLLGATVGQWI